jgi:CheY-like chemotaxis protein
MLDVDHYGNCRSSACSEGIALSAGEEGEYTGKPGHDRQHTHRAGGAASRILIVEDAADTRDAFAIYFMVQGFNVETAHDGIAAIDAARRLRPDVIVMDVAMPGLDGIGATQELRRDPSTADIPVVLLTAYPIRAIRAGALESGASFMMKPCRLEDLEEHIRGVLDARRCRHGGGGAAC